MWCNVGGQHWLKQLHEDTASCDVMWCNVGGQQWLRQLHEDTASCNVMWCTVGGQQWLRQLHADTASCNVMWCTVGGQQWLGQLHADTASWEETATWSTRFNEWRDRTKPTADKSFVRHRDWGEFTLLHMSSSWLCDIHLLAWISLRLWFFVVCVCHLC